MRKIIFTALGSALIALSVANAASAAERHHPRRAVQQPTYDHNTNLRNSRAEFGPVYPSYPAYDPRGWGGGDARAWGGAISAPAGH
jgi:hypothetical protein